MKTCKLTGISLDWAVSKCEGYTLTTDGVSQLVKKNEKSQVLGSYTTDQGIPYGYSPSSRWEQGGPIVERERIILGYINNLSCAKFNVQGHNALEFGQTPLVAAMRCYVASKLGSEVEVPRELISI